MNSFRPWTTAFAHNSPIFEPVSELAAYFSMPDWPDLDDYQGFVDALNLGNAQGTRLQVTNADARGTRGYEQRIFNEATLPIRLKSWHDFFNLLVWARFPKSKAMLNCRHNEHAHRDAAGRGELRDALTLFDESGAIIVSDDTHLIEALRAHAWHALFWQHRALWGRHIECWIFGHAIYEKALDPYIGLTAKALCVPVNADYFVLDKTDRAAYLDAAVALAWRENRPVLSPLPVLGVPGWCSDNASQVFYANRRYFRPR